MATIGMDPSAVRALADEMDRVANQLHALIGAANGSVGRMHAGWLGADAEQLVTRWQRQSRPALETLAGHVHTMARTARTQAQQQDVASSASGVAASAGAESAMGYSSPDALTTAATLLTAVSGGLAWFTRPYTIAGWLKEGGQALRHRNLGPAMTLALRRWDGAASAVKSLAGKSFGEAANWLRRVDPDWVRSLGKSAERVSTLGSLVSIAANTTSSVDAYRHGDSVNGYYYAADASADALKMSHNPVAYVGGVAVSVWTDAGREAQKIDWTTPLPPLNSDTITSIYGAAVVDTFKQLPGRAMKWFL